MSFVKKLLKLDGMTNSELKKMTSRSRFEDYLPWVAYDPETNIYLNQDNSTGFMFECSPLAFANTQTINTLEGLFRLDVPEGSIIQFILFADPEISHYLNRYVEMKARELEVTQESAKRFTEHIRKGTKGLENISNIPVRDFRLFVTFKFPLDRWSEKSHNIKQLQATAKEVLIGAKLYPETFEVELLLDWMRRIFNNKRFAHRFMYDEDIPINKQVILSDTVIEKKHDFLKVDEGRYKCLTPKLFPEKVHPYQTNMLFGGLQGVASDIDQITTPFLCTINIIFANLRAKIHAKCSLVLQQQAIGSFAPSLKRKKDEYLWAVDEIEKGTRFFKIMPIVWILGDTEKNATESMVKIKRIWEQQGYIMQEDKGILDILWLSSLPFGLYNVKSNIENIERDFIAPSESITPVLPVQADFMGGGDPHLIFLGRKGQICSLNLFDKGANNANSLVMGTTGSGKSFFINYLCINEFSNGAMVRIVDIGGSYKKLVKLCNARYMDFSPENTICVNPFTNIGDIDIDLPAIANLIAQMIYSQSDEEPDETESTLIKEAVQWAYNQEGASATTNTVYAYLKSYPSSGGKEIENLKAKEVIIKKAHNLAFNLKEFTSYGQYGRYFVGESEFDIAHDEFVVLELEHLIGRPDLFKVMTKLVINAVTQDLYLSDRSRNRLIVFDEFWQYGKGNLLKETCESAYRRVRKYGGGITIITQSILDMKQFGELGDVLMANSAFKFYLESPVIERAKNEKLIDYEEFMLNLLKTLKSNRPKYSEIFIDGPFGQGIIRLVVDPYSYYVYTSDAKETAKIEEMIKSGLTYNQAILKMLEEQENSVKNILS